MKKPTLTQQESDLYIKIVLEGNYDDMFDFGYAVGRASLAKEELDRLTHATQA